MALIKTRGRSIDSLRRELQDVWLPRMVSSDWLVRMEARPRVDYLQTVIKRRERDRAIQYARSTGNY